MRECIYRRTAELMEAEVGDELVALDAEAGVCFGFNEVATTVWRALRQPRSFDELREALLEQYDVGDQQCALELGELLEDMAARKLIESG